MRGARTGTLPSRLSRWAPSRGVEGGDVGGVVGGGGGGVASRAKLPSCPLKLCRMRSCRSARASGAALWRACAVSGAKSSGVYQLMMPSDPTAQRPCFTL